MSYTLTDLQQAFKAGLEEVFRRKKASLDIHKIRSAITSNPHAQQAIQQAKDLSNISSTSGSLSNTPENVSAAQQVLRSASKNKPSSKLNPKAVSMGRTIQENWDKPHQLAAVYGQNFASPKEQQQLFEAANQGKQYKEILNDKDYRESLLNSFNKVYAQKDPTGREKAYILESEKFSTPGGGIFYSKASPRYPTRDIMGNTAMSLHSDLRGRRLAPALEGVALQNLAAEGYNKSTSDWHALTSEARQTGYERNREKYPGLIKVNPNFRQGRAELGPLYTIMNNELLGKNLQRDSGRNLILNSHSVMPSGGTDGILFIPTKSLSDHPQLKGLPTEFQKELLDQQDFKLRDEDFFEGSGEWNIHRTHPEGFSRGSLYYKDKNFVKDPRFIDKHQNQFQSLSHYNKALQEAGGFPLEPEDELIQRPGSHRLLGNMLRSPIR